MRLNTICAAAVLAAIPIGAHAAPLDAPPALGGAQRSDLIVNAGGPYRRYAGRRDCRPFNGPFGYYGNPWCEGGWKYTEDRFDSYGSWGTWYLPRSRTRSWRR